MSVTFSERKHFMWRDKLMEGIFFIRELRTPNSFIVILLSAEITIICQTIVFLLEARAWTWEHKQSAVWSGAWRRGPGCASRWRPSDLRWPELSASRWSPVSRFPRRLNCMLWHDCFKAFFGVKYLINSRHDCKYGSVCDDGCFNFCFWETGCHLMSLVRGEQIRSCNHSSQKHHLLLFLLAKRNLLIFKPGRTGRTLPQWRGTCVCVQRPSGRPPRCESGRWSWWPR